MVGVTRAGALVHVSWGGEVSRPQVPGLCATSTDPASGLVYALAASAEGITLCQIN